jgi:hypothetical protein
MTNRCKIDQKNRAYGLRSEGIGGEIKTGEKDGVGNAAAAFTATAGQNDVVFMGRSRGLGDLLLLLLLLLFLLFRGINVIVTGL